MPGMMGPTQQPGGATWGQPGGAGGGGIPADDLHKSVANMFGFGGFFGSQPSEFGGMTMGTDPGGQRAGGQIGPATVGGPPGYHDLAKQLEELKQRQQMMQIQKSFRDGGNNFGEPPPPPEIQPPQGPGYQPPAPPQIQGAQGQPPPQMPQLRNPQGAPMGIGSGGLPGMMPAAMQTGVAPPRQFPFMR